MNKKDSKMSSLKHKVKTTTTIFKDIAKGDFTLTVEAARNHTAVAEDAEVVAKTITKYAVSHIIA